MNREHRHEHDPDRRSGSGATDAAAGHHHGGPQPAEEHPDHGQHDGHGVDPDSPQGRRELNRLAVTATAHCLTGCAIGEVLGFVIGTSLGWSNFATIALAVGLAFLFGYSFTIVPVLRSGLALGAAAGWRSWPTPSPSP